MQCISILCRYLDIQTALISKDFGVSHSSGKKDHSYTYDHQDDIVWRGSIGFDKNTKIKIKEESVLIELAEDKTYESKYRYLTINETPILFLMPLQDSNTALPFAQRIDRLSYSMKNNELSDRAYFLHVLDWCNKYQNHNPLIKLSKVILNKMYKLTREIVEDLEFISDRFKPSKEDNLESINAVLESIKPSFFDSFYEQDKDFVLKFRRKIVLEDLKSILHDLFPDAYEDYEKMDVKRIYKLYDTIYELYNTNEYVRKKIDQRTREKLEERWNETINNQLFILDVLKSIKLAAEVRSFIGTNYTIQKMTAVMFHKKLSSLTYVAGYTNQEFGITIYFPTLIISKDKYYAQLSIPSCPLFFIVYAPKHALNWSFGAFNIINRLDVLKNIEDEIKFSDYYDLYYKRIHKLNSVEAIYHREFKVLVKKIVLTF